MKDNYCKPAAPALALLPIRVTMAGQLRFAADADLASAPPAQLKPLRGVRCQDGERRIRGRFCTGRNGFGLGGARPVGLTTEAQVLSVADES